MEHGRFGAVPSSAAPLTLWVGKVTEGNLTSPCLSGHLLCKAVLDIQELDSGMLSSPGKDTVPCWACSWHCQGGVWWVLPAGTVSSRSVAAGRHSRALALGMLHRESIWAA